MKQRPNQRHIPGLQIIKRPRKTDPRIQITLKTGKMTDKRHDKDERTVKSDDNTGLDNKKIGPRSSKRQENKTRTTSRPGL